MENRGDPERGLHVRVLRALADRHRRLVLGIVLERRAPVSEAALARAVAAREPAESPDRARTRVHHADLPKLCSVGLVGWDPREGLVVCDDDPIYDDPAFRWLLDGPTGFEPGEVDANLELLASDGCLDALSVLEARGRLDVTELAARIVASKDGGGDRDGAATRRTFLDLVHNHLPRLAEAGVVEIRGDGTEAIYTGNRFLEVWRDVTPEVDPDI